MARDSSATLFYGPLRTPAFAGWILIVPCTAIGAIAGVVFDHLIVGTGVGVVAGLSIGAVRKMTGDTAGVLLRVRDGVLTIERGKSGWQKIAEAPLTDVVDVTLAAARIAITIRRAETVYFPTGRASTTEAEESRANIQLFLESQGWKSAEDRRRKTKLVKANETGKLSIMGLLVTPTEAASDAVRMVRQKFEIDLDYSIDSLKQVDELVDRIAAESRSTEERRAWVLLFGCYTGECLVQAADAIWTLIADDETLQEHFDPELQFVLRLGKTIANPIGKAWKRLQDGPEDSLFGFARTSIALAKAHDRSSA